MKRQGFTKDFVVFCGVIQLGQIDHSSPKTKVRKNKENLIQYFSNCIQSLPANETENLSQKSRMMRKLTYRIVEELKDERRDG